MTDTPAQDDQMPVLRPGILPDEIYREALNCYRQKSSGFNQFWETYGMRPDDVVADAAKLYLDGNLPRTPPAQGSGVVGVKHLQDLIDIQCSKGNYDCDEYMRGMANGLLLAMSVFDGKEPQFKPAPTPPQQQACQHAFVQLDAKYDDEIVEGTPTCIACGAKKAEQQAGVEGMRQHVNRMLGYAPDYTGRLQTRSEMDPSLPRGADDPVLISLGGALIQYLNNLGPDTSQLGQRKDDVGEKK